jgi:outer membrane lipoprotein-sorting protein
VKRAYFILALSALSIKGDTLEAVLNRMDQAAKTFKSMSADVHKTEYSEVLDETNTEDGTFKMTKKAKSAVTLLADFQGRDGRAILIADSKAKVYHPKANSVEIYETRGAIKSVDSLLLIGFGTPRAELEKKFRITLGGLSETVDGKKATRIDLTPNSKGEQDVFNTIQLWIPENEGNPIQEKVLKGKGYYLLQFKNRAINPPLPPSAFELNLPKDVKVIPAGK